MKKLSALLLLPLAAGCAAESESQASATSPAGTPEDAEAAAPAADPASPPMTTETTEMTNPGGLYAVEATTLEGEPADLSEYAGKVTLVVNVASRCGYTGQYAGLQELHAELADQGFAVLAFPSNEFGGQEPGSPAQIREFCTSSYGVSFPILAKCEVKPGAGQSPVYAFLEGQTGEVPGWNFCKYLVGKDGQVVDFFESGVAPDSDELRAAIEAAMG